MGKLWLTMPPFRLWLSSVLRGTSVGGFSAAQCLASTYRRAEPSRPPSRSHAATLGFLDSLVQLLGRFGQGKVHCTFLASDSSTETPTLK